MLLCRLLVPAGCLLFVASHLLAQGQETLPGRTTPAPTLKTAKEQMSYAMGLNLGSNIGSAEVDLDPALVAKGLMDALQRVQPAMTDEQIGAAIEMFGKAAEAKAKERFMALGEQNKKAGPGFLADNKKQQGVIALPSGLQVQVLKQGTGPQAQKTDRVLVHYTGRFINDQVFDTTAEMKEPLELGVTEVIPGWTEALLRMKVGDKWKLTIPSELAYGAAGSPPTIPPNAVSSSKSNSWGSPRVANYRFEVAHLAWQFGQWRSELWRIVPVRLFYWSMLWSLWKRFAGLAMP